MKDNRDPTIIGKAIIGRPDPKQPAHERADQLLKLSMNSKKTHRGMAGHITRLKHDS